MAASDTQQATVDALSQEVQQQTGSPLSPELQAQVQQAVVDAGGDYTAAKEKLAPVLSQASQPADAPAPADPNVANAQQWADIGSAVTGAVGSVAGAVKGAVTDGVSALPSPADSLHNYQPNPLSGQGAGSYPALAPDPDAKPTAASKMAPPPGAATDNVQPTTSPDTGLQTLAGMAGPAQTIQSKLAASGTEVPPSVALQLIDPSMVKRGTDPHVATPQAFVDNYKDLTAEGEQFATTDEGQTYREKLAGDQKSVLDDWASKKKELADLYTAAKDRVGWAEAASMLGQGLAQLGAGLYGMRTGVDTSGIKFDYYDWSKQYTRALDEYKLNLDQAHEEIQPRLAAIQEQRKDYENWQLRMNQAANALGSSQQQVNEFNARIKNDNDKQYLQQTLDVAKYNATESNAAERYKQQFAIEAARVKQSAATPYFHMGEQAYVKAADDWQKSRTAYAEGLAGLQEAANTSNQKDREKLVQAAVTKIGAYTEDPAAVQKALGAAGKTGGFLGLGGHTDYDAAVKALDAIPKRRPPQAGDFLPGGANFAQVQGMTRVAGDIGLPVAPATNGATTQPTPGPGNGAGVAAQPPQQMLGGKLMEKRADGKWYPAAQVAH